MKPPILIFVDHYLPGFRMGGPLRSIVNLVDHLHDEFDFRIVTADRDLGDGSPYPGAPVDRRVATGKALVVPSDQQHLSALARIVRETPHDLVYLNSFFSFRFTIFPLVARRLGIDPRPVVIAPRGELPRARLR